jgi:hypothetical protein
MQQIINRKVVITNKGSFFEYNLKNNITISDLKTKIARDSNLNIDNYYLFYNNVNLLEQYNNMSLGEILSKIDYEDPTKEEVLNMVSKAEFQILLISGNKLHCVEHPTNSAYLYCKKCETTLCDKCKLISHKSHPNDIIDQNTILDSYYRKVEHFQYKYSKTFGKINTEEIFNDLENTLEEFVKKEISNINSLAEDLKSVIDEIKFIEIERLMNLKIAAKKKFDEFKKDIEFLVDLKKNCIFNK